MASVKINRTPPVPPKVTDAQITLTPTELNGLSVLLRAGAGYSTIIKLGLMDLTNKLPETPEASQYPSRRTAVLVREY